jgi:hypothetical protein
MDDQQILHQIGELAAEERLLEEAHVGDGLSEAERVRLSELERTLDQMWDLLRQRRALRSVGRDPVEAATRPEGTVEHYQQ